MHKKHIVCFHLLNDYSGSPRVLKMVLRGLMSKGWRVDLVSSSGWGVLDELASDAGIRYHTYPYNFSHHKVLTLLRYCVVQIYTFCLAFRWLTDPRAVFYINTLLPVGPALAGRLMGKRVIYHYHENASAKGMVYKALAWAMQRLAHNIICVSEYQRNLLQRTKGVIVVPNAVAAEFVERLHKDADAHFATQTVLMVSSLRIYKGVMEFLCLATMLPQYRFVLVANADEAEIDDFIRRQDLDVPHNLTIHPRQGDVVPFYNDAALVLNLTHADEAVETFGLTSLEAMSAGVPVIVPPCGGVAELVSDGMNGYAIDARETDRIAQKIDTMLSDAELYRTLSEPALHTAERYSERAMIQSITEITDNR